MPGVLFFIADSHYTLIEYSKNECGISVECVISAMFFINHGCDRIYRGQTPCISLSDTRMLNEIESRMWCIIRMEFRSVSWFVFLFWVIRRRRKTYFWEACWDKRLHTLWAGHTSEIHTATSATRVLLSILCAMFINLANSSSNKFEIEIDVDKMKKKMLEDLNGWR